MVEILASRSHSFASLRMTDGEGLSPSLKYSDGTVFSSQFRTANVEGLTPKSSSASTGSDPKLAAEGDAQLSAQRVGQRAMYRLYNRWTGEHFYTADEQERDDVAAAGWSKESIGWVAPKESSVPVYRLYNSHITGGDHHYTPNAEERDNLVKVGWIYEGIGWYSADEGSLFRAPVYRQYNPNADTGTHNYTLSTSERDNLIKAGWRDEGVGYYGLDQSLMSAVDFDKDIKVTTDSKVYNGKEQTQIITSTNLKENEDYVVEYANNKNVGTATITITGTNGFYGEKVYTFQITQKTISQVKWGDLEFGYDGKAHVPTATAVGLCSGDSATVTVTASGNHTDTGTYTATATAISNKNYKLASGLKTDFRIGTKIDFDDENKPTVNTNDEVYTGSAITKDVSVAGLTKDKDYSVTYKDNVNVGTATLTITGKGEYFGEKSYTFKINQRDISSAKVTLGASLTYNGSAQTQTVLKVAIDLGGSELVVPATSYVISDNEKTDAGSYSLKITGNGNFKGTVNKDFEIAKLDISNATVTLGESLTYNGSEQTQNVSKLVAGGITLATSDYAVSDNKQTNAGTYTLKVAGACKNVTGECQVEFSIEQATPEAPTGLTATAYTDQTLADVTLPTLPVGFDGTLAWKDTSTSTGTSEGTITAPAIYTPTDKNYKAVEVAVTVTVETNLYWFAVAGAEDPKDEAGILKAKSEIDEDMKVLHEEKDKTLSGKDKAAIEEEYTYYMNGKSADGTEDKEVRLYTKWNVATGESESADVTGKNAYVEFRIIQVGAHDNDGSAVTFMATHSLPTAKQMNSSSTNAGSWADSLMRNTTMTNYVKAGLSDLCTSDESTGAKTINKVTTSSCSGSWTEGSTTSDQFWLLSFSEIFGESSSWITGLPQYHKVEGTQYDWCKTNVTNPDSSNTAIANMNKTRAGGDPTHCSVWAVWWTRSPSVSNSPNSLGFASVNSDGSPTGDHANLSNGVVPAFSF